MSFIRLITYFSLLFSSPLYAIVGGNILDNDEIPAAVVHLKTTQKNGVEYCTGTLISSNTVLTAAHCLGKSLRLIDKYRPKVEVTIFENGEKRALRANEYIAHPGYEKNEKVDLALIFLDQAVELYEYPKIAEARTKDRLHVLGFGLSGESDKIDGLLRQTFIDIKDIHPRYFSSFNIETGPCSGDSGGAVYRKGSQTQEILGVTYYVNPSLTKEQQDYLSKVRWDRSKLIEAYPLIAKKCFNSTSYFMNVSSFRNWIEKNTRSGHE